MKNFNLLTFFSIIIFSSLHFGCSKKSEDPAPAATTTTETPSTPTTGGCSPTLGTNLFAFCDGTTSRNYDVARVSNTYTDANDSLVITGKNSTTGTDTYIDFTIKGIISTGTFIFNPTTSANLCTYKAAGSSTIYLSSSASSSLTVNVTTFTLSSSTVLVKGTYSGKLYSSSGTFVEIASGSFNTTVSRITSGTSGGCTVTLGSNRFAFCDGTTARAYSVSKVSDSYTASNDSLRISGKNGLLSSIDFKLKGITGTGTFVFDPSTISTNTCTYAVNGAGTYLSAASGSSITLKVTTFAENTTNNTVNIVGTFSGKLSISGGASSTVDISNGSFNVTIPLQ